MATAIYVKDLKGMIRTPANPVSIDDMNEAIKVNAVMAQGLTEGIEVDYDKPLSTDDD